MKEALRAWKVRYYLLFCYEKTANYRMTEMSDHLPFSYITSRQYSRYPPAHIQGNI